MAKAKKRPSKSAKAAQKLLNESKMLADKAERDLKNRQEFKSSAPSPRTNTTAMKPRPHKKRG